MGILKNQLNSNLGLKGATPDLRAGALNTSELHAQGKPASLKADHSVHDLDGKTPEKYLDNKPE
jgi:hypothetical protein